MTTDTTPLTPMMAQWNECKEEAKEALLFFRLGDFYEAFHEDAAIIAEELDLTLTERQGIRMCGVPWHTSEGYIDRLVMRGHKVAIAEQIEDPKTTKGLVKRKIVRIASSGTVIASPLINEKQPNFIAALSFYNNTFGLSLIDVTTGTFATFETKEKRELMSELFKEAPKEIICSKKIHDDNSALFHDLTLSLSLKVRLEESWRFDYSTAEEALKRHCKVHSLDGFGLKAMPAAIASAGALISYLKDSHVPVDHLRTVHPLSTREALLLDRQTLGNLEVIDTESDKRKNISLCALLDRCRTAMGSRMLREWLKNPLVEAVKISKRQDAIEELMNEELLQHPLSSIKDLERLSIRLKTGCAGPKDCAALRSALAQIPHVRAALFTRKSDLLRMLLHDIASFPELHEHLERALVDAPPFRASEGGLFKRGYSQELDELFMIRHSSHEWLADYQNKLREETGIKTLKVGFTRMFGYYIEVSKVQAEKMPSTFMRRQTLVNAERYLTAELKSFEDRILSADERIQKLELSLFEELKKSIATHLDAITKTAQAIAQVDALLSLAAVATTSGYIRPVVDDSLILDIEGGRHPVIESLIQGSHFVPNDLFLDGTSHNLIILTGPNMAGKSTYIRQIALLVIMAQIGSFIPAKRAHIGIIDKLFSRIGASDDLARGQSTFMVEMTETASILHQATARSLVILDEIGRGTSTYDGISIAWAVAEYLVTEKAKCAKTLFATHYYELTEMETEYTKVKNASVAVSEYEGQIRFLHKIVQGKTDKSYGIHVAELAGLPQPVIKRAKTLLMQLEKKNEQQANKKSLPPPQLDLFLPSKHTTKELNTLQMLRALDINTLTPLQAMTTLNDIIKNLI